MMCSLSSDVKLYQQWQLSTKLHIFNLNFIIHLYVQNNIRFDINFLYCSCSCVQGIIIIIKDTLYIVPLVDLQRMTNSIPKNDTTYKHELISKYYICKCITAALQAYIITSRTRQLPDEKCDHPQ